MKNSAHPSNTTVTLSMLRLALLWLLLLVVSPAPAATVTWTGLGGDANWTTPGNWTPGAPVAMDTLAFDSLTQVYSVNNFAADTPFGGIIFPASAGGFTIGGNSLTLAGNLLNSTIAPQAIDLPVSITNAVTFDLVGDVTIGGTISGSGGALTKLGAGTLILSNKTYTGGTTISNGLLVVNNDNGGYTLSGGALKLNYFSYWSGPNVAFNADARVGTDASRLDFAGSIGAAGYTWTKIGSGTMNMVYWGADPTAVVKASAIRVAEGTLGTVVNGGPIAQLGSTNVSIVVSNGAALSLNDGAIAPNSSITLEGGVGTGRGALLSGQVNAGINVTNIFTGNITLLSETTIGTFGGQLILAGNISGTGPVTRIGAADTVSQNKLILGGTNTWTGGMVITTGLVQLASSQALPVGDVSLANDAVLDLGGNSVSLNALLDDAQGLTLVDNSSANACTLTFGGNNQAVTLITPVKNTGGGPLSIVKVGSGAASLLGPNTYSGSNVVSGGKLEIYIPTGTTTANGPVVVADGAELSLRFRLAGSSIKATGATLGGSGTTTLDCDLGGSGNPSQPIINAANGSGVLSANGTINVNFSGDASVMSVGQFPIVKYTTRAGNGVFVLGTVPAGVTAQIVTNASGPSIDLKITSAPVTTWVGNVNNLWDINTTANWSILGVGNRTYVDGVGVLFGDGALTNYVDLTGTVLPSATLVSSASDYTFYSSSLAGYLGGGDLNKGGSGKLTLLTPNGYANTTIAGGTLQVDTNGTTATLGWGNVANEGTLVYSRADAVDLISVISGGGVLVQEGSGTLTLSAANTYSGGTRVNQGRVRLGTPTALGAPGTGVAMATVASGAGLDINGKLVATTNVTRAAGAGLDATEGAVFNNGSGTCVGCGDIGINSLYLAGDIVVGGYGGDWVIGASGNGITGNGYNVTKVGNNILYLRKSTIGTIGTFTVGGGGILIESANPFGTGTLVVLTNNASLDSWGNNSGFASYTIANNILVTNGGGRITNTRGHWWNIPDSDTYTGAITLADNLTVQNSSANGANRGVLTIAGPISGPGGVAKAGAYLVTLSGANTYTGTTWVTNGTLALSTQQQGGGAYVVEDTGTLDVPNQVGSGTLPMASLTMGSLAGGTINLSRVSAFSTTTPLITATSLTVLGNNTIMLPVVAYSAPGQFPLIKYTGAVAGGGTFALPAVRGTGAYISNNLANSSIDLVITTGNPVAWVGNLSTNWDIGITANWLYQSAATTYQQAGASGDAVIFNDSAIATGVGIVEPVSPVLVTVNNSARDFTFYGTNITGATALIKSGSGSLTLSNLNNNFAGGTLISGGTIRIGSDGALNNSGGIVTVTNGGTLDLAGLNPSGITINASGAGVGGMGAIVANYAGGNQNGPGTINMTGDLTLGGTNRWDLRNGARTFNTPTNAFTLTKVGSGQIVFNGTIVSPNLGDIKVLAGNFTYESGTAGLGNPTNVIRIANGATLGFWQAAVPLNKSIICSNGANFGVAGGNTASLNVIAGPVQLVGGGVNINANYNNGIVFSNVISGDGGIWVQWNSDVLFSAANTFKGDIETQGRLKLVANASINPTNNVTVNNSGSGVLTVQDNAVVGGQNLRIWSGPGTGALIVKNNGTINSKFIQVGNAFADWSGRTDGTLTLQSGQTFRIDNGGRVKGNVVVASGSTFSPGGGYYIQSTGYMTNNLTLQADSTTFMDISVDGGVATNDAVTVLGTLTYGGTLQINRIGTAYLAPGNTFKLFNFTGSPGSFAGVTANTPGQNVIWDTSQLAVNGTLRVTSVFNTFSPTLVSSVSAGNLTLSWPAGHLGWRLLVQTNNLAAGLSTNPADWGDVPGSSTVNSVTIPIDTTKPSVFYRMVYP